MKRNKFSLSHYKLLTCNMGNLVPLTWYEANPGDTIQQKTSLLIRTQPLLAPVMHPVRVRVHHWFVPNRLIFDDWEDFITGGEDGLDASVHPYKTITSATQGTLRDYIDLPVGTYTEDVNVLPWRAYALIFNEWYRDQDLVTALTIDTTDGADTTTNNDLQSVAWEKDYFTTARPWEQKGTAVTIPLGGDAPITGLAAPDAAAIGGSTSVRETDGSSATTYTDGWKSTAQNIMLEEDPSNANYPNVRADLSAATGMSINDLRLSVALQKYMENRARFGARYSEWLASQGVKPRDARLQTPEYLGGGRQTIQFSEVLAHSDVSGEHELGGMGGHGIAAMQTNRYRKFIEEHGIIMTLMSVLPKTIYAQGLHKKFSRTAKEDYFQRELQHLGEQEVYNKEVYAEHTTPDGTFGYQAIYDDFRSLPSNIAGEFNDGAGNDHWHMARIFASDPSLNSTFVTAAPTTRIYAATGSDQLYIMANHSIQARRMMTKVSTPRLMG